MASEHVPAPSPSAAPWLTRSGLSGKLLAIGAVVGVIGVFLPLFSITVETPNPGPVFGMPGMPSGLNVPVMNVSHHAMVIDSWQGRVGLAAYVATLALAFVLYPPTGLAQKSLAWAGVAVGGLAALVAVWLLIAAIRNEGDAGVPGFGHVAASVGIGAFVNVLAAGTVMAGGLLKARMEKLF